LQRLLILLLVSCSQEYDIKGSKDIPPSDVVVDTVDTGKPPADISTPETGDTGEEPVALIHVEPYDYDFGEVVVDCSESYDVTISSVGTAPLIIDEFYYINTPDITMVSEYKFPIVMEPGEKIKITFEYNENDLFVDTGKLYIYSNALGKREQKISHHGQGVIGGSHVDVFEFNKINKADILFVVDNSCSMSEEQADLADNAEDFVKTLTFAGTDFQISVITTDNPEPVTPIITNDSYGAGRALAEAVEVGVTGYAVEMGQEMARKSLGPTGALGKGFMREDATLSVVVISDEDDYSPLTDLEYYDFFLSIKEEQLFFFHSVVGVTMVPGCSIEVGTRYLSQSFYTSGVSLDVCGPWGSSLTTLANPVYTIETFYPLSKEPMPSTIKVFIGGFELISDWLYDDTTNSVIFTDISAISGEEPLQISYDYVGDCD
jgi:hypothetical protein